MGHQGPAQDTGPSVQVSAFVREEILQGTSRSFKEPTMVLISRAKPPKLKSTTPDPLCWFSHT